MIEETAVPKAVNTVEVCAFLLTRTEIIATVTNRPIIVVIEAPKLLTKTPVVERLRKSPCSPVI